MPKLIVMRLSVESLELVLVSVFIQAKSLYFYFSPRRTARKLENQLHRKDTDLIFQTFKINIYGIVENRNKLTLGRLDYN